MSRLVRPLLLAVAFCVAAVATIATIYTGGKAVHPALPPLGIWSVVQMGFELAKVEADAFDDQKATVLMIGDSTVMAYPKGRTLYDQLQTVLDRQSLPVPAVQVYSVAAQGMTPGNFYLALDGIVRAKPDIVTIALNLGVIRSYLPPVLRRPELAGWMSARRLPRALVGLPLQHYGVTADQLLFHQLLVRTRQPRLWFVQRREQARVGHFRQYAEDYVAERTGLRTEPIARAARRNAVMRSETLPGDRNRFNERRADEFFGVSMRGLDENHFTMRVLEALLEELDAAGISVVMYVVPTNIDHLRDVGVYNEAGLSKTLSVFRAAADRYGAYFVDAHDLLSDAAFRDAFGHLFYDEPINGPQLLAERLAPDVARVLRRRRGER